MRASQIIHSGPNGTLHYRQDYPKPSIKADEVLIQVAYAALNRADIFQKRGLYPPPEGASELPGLEVSGTIAAVGENITRRKVGDRVCALLDGGGYGEFAVARSKQIFSLPTGWSLQEAAALPEALFTVWLALFHTAKLQEGETVLIHGGASGIGHIAIQMARMAGAIPYVTAGTDDKCEFCRHVGAEKAVNYKQEKLLEAFGDQRFAVILDMVGGDMMQTNLKLLAEYGRLISIAFLAGSKAPLNMASLLFKQASWHGLTLRSRSASQKARLASEIRENCALWLADRSVLPHIDTEFSLQDAEKAHARMEQNLNCGKIVLKVAD